MSLWITSSHILNPEVTRKEYSKGGYEDLAKATQGSATPKYLARFLQADRLVPIEGKVKELAEGNTRGERGDIERAHALYDYVFKTVRYERSGTGWGRGNSLWVCDAKHGNSTDFNSLFISMARVEGIAARVEMGFPVPDRAEGTIPGYDCWAEVFCERPGVGPRRYLRSLEGSQEI